MDYEEEINEMDYEEEMTVGKLKELLREIPDDKFIFADDGCCLSICYAYLSENGNAYITIG